MASYVIRCYCLYPIEIVRNSVLKLMKPMTGNKVLIVEDDKKIALLLVDYLTMSGFKVSVLNRGEKVIPEVRNNAPDLIILDIMLPGKDGISVCSEIRTFSKVPILICTAMTEEIDRILGLEIGADDYICKPFSPREVVARVKAVLRRVPNDPDDSVLAVGPIIIKSLCHTVTVSGKQLGLTPNEFELLRAMAAHPGRVFTRADLVLILKRNCNGVDIRIVDTHMKNLRKKIEDTSEHANIIKTVYGIGYSLDLSSGVFEQKESQMIACISESAG
jgi:two-component system response regulator BaeR